MRLRSVLKYPDDRRYEAANKAEKKIDKSWKFLNSNIDKR